MNYTVSIVICTYNRAPFLKRTLNSLANLNYKNFEIVVVNGPSTDETEDVLEPFQNSIKILKNPQTNLSISRNIGIKASAGDIIAFIDDDAIPDPNWLNDILALYTDPNIGGVGGKVYGPGDDHFQFEGGYVNFWGESNVHYYGADFNDPKGTRYNMMLGTNCTFRRQAIVAIGGFDEYYEYFHDESDACLRMVRSGFKILNHPKAFIHHEFAKSHIRESTFDGCHLNWYPIIKNKIYFALKNSEGMASDAERQNKIIEIRNSHLDDFKYWVHEGKITKAEMKKYTEVCLKAFEKGREDGYSKARALNFDLDNTIPFMKYDISKTSKALKICLLCKDNIFDAVGGIAKYTYELAIGLSRLGQDVHVVTCGKEEADWMQGGISMHTVIDAPGIEVPELNKYPTTNSNFQYSYRVYKKIIELHDKYHIDIIESVLWNFEGAVAARLLKGKLPVVIRLQTPLLKVAETQNWKVTEDLRLFSDFEAQMIKDAAHVIAISEHIKETISSLYPVEFNSENASTVYLGVDENLMVRSREGDNIVILFVGRLERRKGIHTIFEVLPTLLEKYPNVEMRFVGNYEIVDDSLGETFINHFAKTYGKEKWTNRVHFLGQINNKEKNQEFADCDIFIAPSLYESFGIILIEAMSAKKPVIGCRIGGMQEIVEDGKNGFLIDVEDSEALTSCLEELIVSPTLRERMGWNGFERFKKMFSNAAMTHGTLQIYQEILNNNKPHNA